MDWPEEVNLVAAVMGYDSPVRQGNMDMD